MAPKRRIIIDTDAGVDDAVALAMAMTLESKYDYELSLITTCHGNVGVDQVNRNVVALRSACRSATPIVSGAASNLRGETPDAGQCACSAYPHHPVSLPAPVHSVNLI